MRRLYQLALIAGTLFLAVIFGTIAAGKWDVVLSYLESQSFGVTDPQFGKDIGFYVFDLPALRFFYGWLMGMAVLTVLVAAGLYLYRFLSFGAGQSHVGRDASAPGAAPGGRRRVVHLPLLVGPLRARLLRRRRGVRRDLHRHPRPAALHLRRHGAGGDYGAWR